MQEQLETFVLNLKQIYKRYGRDERLVSAGQSLCEPGCAARLRLRGLAGAAKAMALGALRSACNAPVVIFVREREEALYLMHDLELIFPEWNVLLYPASSKRPYQIEQVDNANVLQRAETLNFINKEKDSRAVVVSYPEALFEKVVERTALAEQTWLLCKGDVIAMDVVVARLLENRYQETDFVTEPGQFAVRGGLLDVFSYSYEQPYRIDFFGDEIDKIRLFNPGTQISEGEAEQLSILPDLQMTRVDEKRSSFLEFISSRAALFFQDVQFVADELEKMFDKAEAKYGQIRETAGDSTLRLPPEKLYYGPLQFLEEIGNHPTVEFGSQSFFRQYDDTLEFATTPQPVFKKQFQLLAVQLSKNLEDGFVNIITCENEKQLRRLDEIFGGITDEKLYYGLLQGLHEGFVDQDRKVAIFTDHQIFGRYHRYGTRKKKFAANGFALKELLQLQPGDYVVHAQHGLGRFAGLHIIKGGNGEQEAAKIVFAGNDAIYVNVNSLHKLSKYAGKDGAVPKLNKLGTNEWSRAKARVRKRVKELAFDLVELYAKRKAQKGFACGPDSFLQYELEASFPYEETPDQMKAIEDVKEDLEAPSPMDRLVCGDVGFGKTEVAVRAAFKAAADGKQVAILAPTTVLVMQHYRTFCERLKDMPVRVEYANRFRSKKELRQTFKDLSEGKVDIIIGTHRLLSKDVEFKNLGLFIIDEEHKFGVGDKEKLKLKKVNVDTLTLTATPIPRTLQFSLMGVRDMSVIATPPPNRQPVDTQAQVFSLETLRDAVAYEMRRGGQVFLVHNRVRELEDLAALVKKVVPDARIGIAHGKMKGEDIENVFLKFIDRQYDVLVCTTIIESGLDIPNANTIIINQAHTYGLSDLHQMRGRVGRSNRKAYCYLLSPPHSSLPADARKRLTAIEEFSDIGSGIQIAMRDLDIRGAGDVLGKEQSGFIADVGYDVYQKILNEAIEQLKEERGLEEPKETEEEKILKALDGETVVDTDMEALIPESYIRNTAERFAFYKKISESGEESKLREVARELVDRFGMLPKPVLDLMDIIRLRDLAQKLGFEKVVLAEGKMRIQFIGEESSGYYQSRAFKGILDFLSTQPQGVELKQMKKSLKLIYHSAPDVKTAMRRLTELRSYCLEKPEPAAKT